MASFLRIGFNSLKAAATSRRQFIFYYSVPWNSWYSFYPDTYFILKTNLDALIVHGGTHNLTKSTNTLRNAEKNMRKSEKNLVRYKDCVL